MVYAFLDILNELMSRQRNDHACMKESATFSCHHTLLQSFIVPSSLSIKVLSTWILSGRSLRVNRTSEKKELCRVNGEVVALP